jgi:hypothetical protein
MRFSYIETVIVNEKIVLQNGRLITTDEENILNTARKW